METSLTNEIEASGNMNISFHRIHSFCPFPQQKDARNPLIHAGSGVILLSPEERSSRRREQTRSIEEDRQRNSPSQTGN
jgi:hypothetical protein